MSIFDEYGDAYSFQIYKKRVFNHANTDPTPMKWVYGIDPIDKHFSDNPRKTIYLEKCDPEEAEIWTPFDHVKYFETEAEAKRKFPYSGRYFNEDVHNWNDPDYKIDWTEGEFS